MTLLIDEKACRQADKLRSKQRRDKMKLTPDMRESLANCAGGLFALIAGIRSKGVQERSGQIGHPKDYTRAVMEAISKTDADDKDIRKFIKHFTGKDPIFSNSDVGMTAVQFEAWLIDNHSPLLIKLVETIAEAGAPDFLAIFEGTLPQNEWNNLVEKTQDFVALKIIVEAGQTSGTEHERSDVTIVQGIPVKAYTLKVKELENPLPIPPEGKAITVSETFDIDVQSFLECFEQNGIQVRYQGTDPEAKNTRHIFKSDNHTFTLTLKETRAGTQGVAECKEKTRRTLMHTGPVDTQDPSHCFAIEEYVNSKDLPYLDSFPKGMRSRYGGWKIEANRDDPENKVDILFGTPLRKMTLSNPIEEAKQLIDSITHAYPNQQEECDVMIEAVLSEYAQDQKDKGKASEQDAVSSAWGGKRSEHVRGQFMESRNREIDRRNIFRQILCEESGENILPADPLDERYSTGRFARAVMFNTGKKRRRLRLSGMNRRMTKVGRWREDDDTASLIEGETASTILQQLGGKRFSMMTGAKQFVDTGKGLKFRIGKNGNNVNVVDVTLDPSDTYTVTAYKIVGMKTTEKGKKSGIQADGLRAAFKSLTGMNTSLGESYSLNECAGEYMAPDSLTEGWGPKVKAALTGMPDTAAYVSRDGSKLHVSVGDGDWPDDGGEDALRSRIEPLVGSGVSVEFSDEGGKPDGYLKLESDYDDTASLFMEDEQIDELFGFGGATKAKAAARSTAYFKQSPEHQAYLHSFKKHVRRILNNQTHNPQTMYSLARKLHKRGVTNPQTAAQHYAAHLYKRSGTAVPRNLESVEEGLFDPYILKVVFLAGGGGSGKGFIGGKMFGGTGLRVINSDDSLVPLMLKAGLNPKTDISKTAVQKPGGIRDRAKRITKEKQRLSIDGRMGMIIDGTGASPSRVFSLKRLFEDLGYDCLMVLVNTPLDAALKNNKARARVVPEDIIKADWKAVQSAIPSYKKEFGQNFIEYKNDKAYDKEGVVSTLVPLLAKQAMPFLKAPVKNPIGKKWIEDQTGGNPDLKRLVHTKTEGIEEGGDPDNHESEAAERLKKMYARRGENPPDDDTASTPDHDEVSYDGPNRYPFVEKVAMPIGSPVSLFGRPVGYVESNKQRDDGRWTNVVKPINVGGDRILSTATAGNDDVFNESMDIEEVSAKARGVPRNVSYTDVGHDKTHEIEAWIWRQKGGLTSIKPTVSNAHGKESALAGKYDAWGRADNTTKELSVVYWGRLSDKVREKMMDAVKSKWSGYKIAYTMAEDNDAESLTVDQLKETITEGVATHRIGEKEPEPLRKHFDRWIKDGDTYSPSGPVQIEKNLGQFAFKATVDMWGKPIFVRVRPQTDELYKFENSVMEHVLTEIDKFWDLKGDYDKLGLMYNRGVLMYGPPGTGKTSIVHQVAEMIVERGDVVFYAREIGALVACLKALREVEKDRKCVVILEDADEFLRYGEREFLQLLDGEQSVSNVLYLATTNYLDRFPPRLLRPGRFDEHVFVGPPPREGRVEYLRRKLKKVEEGDDEIDRLADETDGMSFGHLRELVTAVYALKQPVDKVIARLRLTSPLAE